MVDEEVFTFLLERVEETKRIHQEAKRKFWAVAGSPREFPKLGTGLPIPDGSELIRRAVAEETFAMQAHIDAMKQMNQYLLHGTIPEDLPPRLRKTKLAEGSREIPPDGTCKQ